MSRAQTKIDQGDFKGALGHLDRVIKREPETSQALKAAQIAANVAFLELKNFTKAIEYYRHIIMYSKDSKLRYQSQKSIADIYFEKLNDYSNSILEYNKLLRLPHDDSDHYKHKSRVAKSHFQLNDFYQSAIEIESLLKKYKDSPDQVFELSLFKANILLTTKKVDEAINLYVDLLTNYPTKSTDENVPISLAIAYEEKKEFGKAIRVLQDIEAESESEEFIQLKIRRLEERAKNQPGASGLRR
ncbi:MAG: tetratricopeptide repeat protein [Bdellovibrionales bacterium]|nr:tetratricopeptide repeat protein [Bdellovibrionales bacterium]